VSSGLETEQSGTKAATKRNRKSFTPFRRGEIAGARKTRPDKGWFGSEGTDDSRFLSAFRRTSTKDLSVDIFCVHTDERTRSIV